MKLFSRIQLIALALDVFKQYTQEDTCFAREDGNIFFTENYAELGRGKMKVYTFLKSEIEPTNAELGVDAKKAITPVAANSKKATAPVKADATLGKEGKSPETRNTKPVE